MGKEYELKYAATPEKLAAIRSELGNFHLTKMQTTYFDTADGTLSAKRITLRLRRENGKSICCLKTPGNGFTGEWETEAASMDAGLPILCKLCDEIDLAALTQNGVKPICGAAFDRLAKIITVGDSTLELALDQGLLTAGDKTAPICELEAELKSGDPKAVAAYAQALAAKYALSIEPLSKFRRAYALVKGE